MIYVAQAFSDSQAVTLLTLTKGSLMDAWSSFAI